MMDFLYLLPIALILDAVGLAAFMWTLKSSQYDDLEGAAERILLNEGDKPIVKAQQPASSNVSLLVFENEEILSRQPLITSAPGTCRPGVFVTHTSRGRTQQFYSCGLDCAVCNALRCPAWSEANVAAQRPGTAIVYPEQPPSCAARNYLGRGVLLALTTGRFRYAVLLTAMATSSQPSVP